MWALIDHTPYAAERNWLRDKDGLHEWLVAVRATFAIETGGRMRLADEQLPPTLAPVYFGESGTSSLRYDSDLLAAKPGTDVIVLASAHAPRGRPAASVQVALRVGALEKTLIVHGERVYYDGLSATKPLPFITREIRYEHAFGGSALDHLDANRHRIDERNPVGRGVVARGEGTEGHRAHAIEYPFGDPARMGPAGFGPIDAWWLPRRRLAGTYDARWVNTKKPLLPDDYDPAYALCAPTDQRTAESLRGGERIGLANMTPDGMLILELPTIALRFTTRFGRRRREHGPRLTTVLVEPDEHRLSLVWQSVLRVAAYEADELDATEIHEGAT